MSDTVPGSPESLAVRCPHCKKEATFIFAIRGGILKKQSEAFSKHRSFECDAVADRTGSIQYIARYYPGLYESNIKALHSIPCDEDPEKWSTKIYNRKDEDWGTFICNYCVIRKKHRLNWPEDAFYQWSIPKAGLLWAWNRKNA